MSTKKHLIYIAGPTAVGKTDLTIRLAQHFQTEIISCDARQMYEQMNIGTAKPTAEELAAAPHHFIDFLPITAEYSAGKFEQDALTLLESLFEKHSVVLMTGGSAFYAQAVMSGFDEIPAIDQSIQEKIIASHKEKGLAWLQSELMEKDAALFETLNQSERHNHQRLIRALAFWETHQESLLKYRQKKVVERPFSTLKIGLTREREELYKRINLRVELMVEAGLLEEVKSLMPYKDLNAMQTVGYHETVDYVLGIHTELEWKELIKRNSRRYAKRQMTWYRREEGMNWFHPDEIGEIIDFVEKALRNA